MSDFTNEQIAMYNNLLNNIGSYLQIELRGSVYKDRSLSYRNTSTTLSLRILNESRGVLVGNIYKDNILRKTVSYPVSLGFIRAPYVFIARLVEEID